MRTLVNQGMRVDMIVVRTSGDGVVACIHTPENDLTEGQEGMGDNLAEALYDLAATIEEVLFYA